MIMNYFYSVNKTIKNFFSRATLIHIAILWKNNLHFYCFSKEANINKSILCFFEQVNNLYIRKDVNKLGFNPISGETAKQVKLVKKYSQS
jgi:hypothetical protein